MRCESGTIQEFASGRIPASGRLHALLRAAGPLPGTPLTVEAEISDGTVQNVRAVRGTARAQFILDGPLAQPRNLVGGHMISGLVGAACWQMFGDTVWIAAALGVSLAIVAMLATKTLHPPGGATALIAVIGGPKIHALGFLYAFIPAGAGALVLLLVALVVNNLSKNRRYPEYWI